MQSHYRELSAGTGSCSLITESFQQEMSHTNSLQRAFYRKFLLQSRYRDPSAENVSCKLIKENFLREMSHAISLQRAFCWNWLTQSYNREVPTGNISCNLTTISFLKVLYLGSVLGSLNTKQLSWTRSEMLSEISYKCNLYAIRVSFEQLCPV